MIWAGRILTLAVTLLGLALIVAGFPFNDVGHSVLALVGLSFLVCGGMVVWSDAEKVFHRKP